MKTPGNVSLVVKTKNQKHILVWKKSHNQVARKLKSKAGPKKKENTFWAVCQMWTAVSEVILALKRSASLQIKAMPSTLADKNPQL